MKKTILAIIMFELVLHSAQKSYGQTDTKHVYSSEISENFRRLNFNWALTPPNEAEMNEGINSLKNGEWKSALDFFDKVIEFDSTFVPAYYFKFSCYEIGNRVSTEKAFINLKYVTKKIPKASRDTYTDLWDIYVPNKKHSRRNNSLLEIAPPLLRLSRYLVEHQHEITSESFSNLKRAFSLLVIAKPNEAISLCDKSIKLESSTCASYIKAVAFQLLLQHDSAYYLFNEIVKKDELIIEAHENLALYKNQLNDKVGVIKHLTALNKIEPESPEIWRFSGILKAQIHDYYGSILDLTKYINTDSTDFDCLKQRAIAEYSVKNYRGSLRDLNSALKLSDKDLEIFFYKSDNYLHVGDSIESIKVLRDAEKIFSFSQDLDLFTANKLVEVNKLKQAQEIIDRVVRVVLLNHFNDKYLHQANLIQCKIYLKKGLPDKALDKLNSLIDKEGEYLDYLFLRAEVYIKKGDKVNAKADLIKLVKEGFQPAIDLYSRI